MEIMYVVKERRDEASEKKWVECGAQCVARGLGRKGKGKKEHENAERG